MIKNAAPASTSLKLSTPVSMSSSARAPCTSQIDPLGLQHIGVAVLQKDRAVLRPGWREEAACSLKHTKHVLQALEEHAVSPCP